MDAKKTTLSMDTAAALTIMFLSVFFYFYLIPVGINVPNAVKHLPLSPRFLPYVLTIFIFVIASIMLVLSIIAAPKSQTEEDTIDLQPTWRRKLGILAIVLVMYWYLPEVIGMLMTSITSICILLLVSGEKRLKIYSGVGILIPIVVYFTFTEIFYVSLPPGILFQN